MGFLGREIRRGVSRGIGRAVGEAIGRAIEPTITYPENQTARSVGQTTINEYPKNVNYYCGDSEAVTADSERRVQDYAAETVDMKNCPDCGKASAVHNKFCPDCGAVLPEQTLAEYNVCPSCGQQDDIGAKFCRECGTKLPVNVQEKQIAVNIEKSYNQNGY